MDAANEIRFAVGLPLTIVTNVTLLILVSGIAVVFAGTLIIFTIRVAALKISAAVEEGLALLSFLIESVL